MRQTGSYSDVGIFRSTDGGKTFTQISNGNGTLHGLPEGITYDLVADPVNPSILYTAVVGADGFGGANGIYKSTNTGATWTKVSSLALDGFLNSGGNTVTHNVQISVGRSNQIYVGIVNRDSANVGEDKLAAVFRSGNGGGSWTMMDLPKTVDTGVTHGIELEQTPFPAGDPLATLPSGQGSIGFSIVADPSNVNLVYVGGGAQPVVGAGSQIGATDYCGRLFRGDASKPTGSQWVSLTDSNTMGPIGGGTASNSSPHADSRGMTFDAAGRLIEVNDGGVYYRSSPQNNSGDWYSLNGNLQISEVQNVAYDSISNVALASSKDVGVSEETAAGGTTWREVSEGYGGDIAVNDVSLAAQNESYRYSSTEYLQNFECRTVNANNNIIATTKPALVVNGSGGQTFSKLDGGQITTPVALNVVNPSRMIIGGATSLFESYDDGATLTDLNAVGNATAVVYGGYREDTPYPDVLWAVSNNGVYLRINTANPITRTNYPGGTPRDIAVDSADWEQAYVIDDSHVWYTANAGQTWTDITGNYSAAAGLRTIEYIASGKTGAILVGGQQGIYGSRTDDVGNWTEYSTALPNVPVYDIDYNAQNNVLVVGTLGRGVWELPDARSEIFSSLNLLTVSTSTNQYQANLAAPTITVAPQQLTLDFNDGQVIDPTTLAGIQITRSGGDGTFYDPVSNPYDTDDVVVTPGWIGIGDKPNEVIIRFASALPADSYRVTIVGQGVAGANDPYYGPDGKLVPPLMTTGGMPVGYHEVTAGGQSYWDGTNFVWGFTLTLPPQVSAVVPQPVSRNADGTLAQARNEIDVYFNEKMDAASAQNTDFYSLIMTNGTADTSDDVVIHPTAAVYTETSKSGSPGSPVYMVALTFGKDANGNPITDLAQIGTGAFRLRVGNEYQPIVTTDRTDISPDDDGDSTLQGATNLGSYADYPPATPLDSSTPQSWVISGNVGMQPYTLEWPGGQDTPGSRSLPIGATDVEEDNHTGLDTGDVGNDLGLADIPVYYYNFQTYYGEIGNTPQINLITDVEKQRIRDIFSLFTEYFGVNFVETANQGITIATGDLRVFGANQPTGNGSPIGGEAPDANGDPLVVINNHYNYDCSFDAPESLNMTNPTGAIQSYMRAAMELLMNALGFGFSYDLAGNEVAGSDPDVPATPLGTADDAFPSNSDIVSGQYLYRPDSIDVNMYKFQVGAGGGDFSAETIAQRMANASTLNTELILFDANGNVLAKNDDYYGNDSFLSLHLDAGTYYIGVSASGNDQYNPNVPDSGIGGTTEGPYQLRLNLQPTVAAQLVNAQSIPLDGDGDGQPGGQYNYWFNVEPASQTLFVNKAATGTTANGSLAHPYKNISDATNAAAANDIVRIVGNNFANDDRGDGIIVDPALAD